MIDAIWDLRKRDPQRMANEPITFFCPACGIKLTVPATLAGVIGPCPTCHTQIQAPIPAALPPASRAQTESPTPQQAVQTAAPHEQSILPSRAVIPPPSRLPVTSTVAASPAVLKPEPRQLPSRSAPLAEVVAKQMPEPIGSGSMRQAKPAQHPQHAHRSGRLVRFLMPVLFLIASGALVYGVLTILKNKGESDSRESPGPAKPSTPPPVQQAEDSPAPAKDKAPTIPALPVPVPAQPSLSEPAPPLPDGIEPKAPGMEALSVLEKFLAAKSLAERLPVIETKSSPEELAESCLARPLPATRSMVIDIQESNPLEEVVDFYYNVDFEGENNRPNPQTILVRTRGRGEPKVVVDPFLDLFGGRLAAYASHPSDKAGVFQVIVYAVASCTDSKIPNREKKLTLKLLARDNTKEIAQAYFGRMSKIGEMLEDGTYSLSYGKARSCTVMLRWNTEDNPEHPYLEAIALKALDWNP